MPDTQRLNDDERYEIALVAAASERRNRPKNLILIPLALFIIASLVLAYALYSVESGKLRLEDNQFRYDRLVQGVVQIKELEAAGAQEDGPDGLAPISDFLSRVEGYARDAGLESKLSIPVPRRDRSRGLVRVRHVYTKITDPSLEHLLRWVELTQEKIPGLFVLSLTLKPAGNRGWSMDITFARWERGESS